ncbi:class II myosin [Mitosporidium daphniae]
MAGSPSTKEIPIWIYDKSLGRYIEGFIKSQSSTSPSYADAMKDDSSSDESIDVHFMDSSKSIKVLKRIIQLKNPEKYEYPVDLAYLTFLNEASIVHVLSHRYMNDLMYTFSGIFLISINPYRQVPNLYSDSVVSHYQAASCEPQKQQPHIFAVAASAYNNLREFKTNQSILVTGESGSGKTENTKKLCQFFATRGSNCSSSIEALINLTNPILESFGNAKTIRNNNSSRFGKYIRLQFSSQGELSGANIDCYLLEKSRVTHHAPLERSFHVFYQLIYGASAELREALFLSNNLDDYLLLKPNDQFDISPQQDIDNFKELIHAFEALGIAYEEYLFYFKSIAVILHLGNVQISCRNENENETYVLDPKHLEHVMALLGLPSTETLISSILKPNITAGRDVVVKGLTCDQISESLGTFMRSLYERTFNSIISRLNSIFYKQEHSARFIGLLDMAGFEIFEKNSFEQLCINYTNEKLQQFFNQHMFHREQLEYKNEGIDWNYIDYGLDLQPTIDLLEKSSPAGIFSLLDEECVLPMTSDSSFTEKVTSSWKGKSIKFEQHRFSSNKGFFLTHYAGKVQYSTDGWISKNKDPINETLSALMTTSSVSYYVSLFSDFQSATRTSVPGTGCFFKTLLQKYKEQLNTLMLNLHSCSPHFVRCIVPNKTKSPFLINHSYVIDQLNCNGVLEGIRICRNGYPNRLFFSDFKRSYFILSKECMANLLHSDDKSLCKIILEEFQSLLPQNSYQIGKSKIMFKAGVLAILESHRDHIISSMISSFQAVASNLLCMQRLSSKSETAKAVGLVGSYLKEINGFYNWPWWKVISSIKPILESRHVEMQTKLVNEEIASLQAERLELIAKINALGCENEELRLNIATKSEDLELVSSSYSEVSCAKDLLAKVNDEQTQEISRLRSNMECSSESFKAQIDEQLGKVQTLQDIVSSLTDENFNLTANLKEQEQNVESISQKACLLESKNQESEHRICELENEIESLTLQNQDFASSNHSHMVEIERLKADLESTNRRHEAYRTELTSQLDDFKQKYSVSVNQLRTENSALSSKLQESEKMARDTNESLQLSISTKKDTELDAKDRELKLLSQKYISLCDNHAWAQKSIEELKNKVFHIDSLLLKNEAEYLQNVSNFEAKNYTLSSELSSATYKLQDFEEKYSRIKETAESTLLCLNEAQESLLLVQRENDQLQETICSLTKSLHQAHSNLQDSKSELTSLEKRHTQEVEYRQNLQCELKESSIRITELESQLFCYKKQVSELKANDEEVSISYERKVSSLEKKLLKLENKVLSLQETLAQVEVERKTLINDKLSYECKISLLELNLSDVSSHLEASTAQIGILKDESASLLFLISSLEKDKIDMQDQLRSLHEQHDAEKQESQKTMDSLNDEIVQLNSKLSDLKSALDENVKTIEELHRQEECLREAHKISMLSTSEKEAQLNESLADVNERLVKYEKGQLFANELLEKVKEYEQTIESLKDENSSLGTSIYGLHSEKDILQSTLRLTEDEFRCLQRVHDTLLQKYKDAQSLSDKISLQLKQQEKAFDSIVDDKILALSQEHAKERDRIKTEYNTKISNIRAENSANLAVLISAKSELEKNLKQLQHEVKVKEQSISNLTGDVDSLNRSTDILNKKHLDLQVALEKETKQCTTYLKELDEKDKVIFARDDAIEAVSQKVEFLSATLRALEQDHSNLELQVEEKSSLLISANAQVDKLEAQLSKLSLLSSELSKENSVLQDELCMARQLNTTSLADANENISTYLNLLTEIDEKLQIKTDELDAMQEQLAQEKLSNNLLTSDLDHYMSKLKSQEICNGELLFALKSAEHELNTLNERFAFQSQNLDELKSVIVSKSVQIEDQNLSLTRQKNLIKELEETNKFLTQSLHSATEDLDSIATEKGAINLGYLELEQKLASLKKDYDSVASDLELEKTMKNDRVSIVNNLRNHNLSLESMLCVERSRVKDLEKEKTHFEFLLNDLKGKLSLLESDAAASSDASKEDEDEIYSVLFSNGSLARAPSIMSLSANGRRNVSPSPLRPLNSSIHMADSVSSLAKSPVYLTLRKQLDEFRQIISTLSKEKTALLATCQELQKKISVLQLNSEGSPLGADSLQDVLHKSNANLLTCVKTGNYSIVKSHQSLHLKSPVISNDLSRLDVVVSEEACTENN